MRKTLKEDDRFEIDEDGIIYNKKFNREINVNKKPLVHLDKCRRTKVVVANNLLENPNNLSNVVNLDGDEENNHPSNLKWCETPYGDPIFDKETDKYIRSKIAAVIANCHGRLKTKGHKYYKAKGIKVCKEWRKSMTFLKWSKENGFQKGYWLYRYNKDKNYSPDNCYWGSPYTKK